MEHTHHDRKQKNAICPSAFGKRYQNDYIAAGTTHRLRSSSQRYHLSPVTSGQLHSSHAIIMAWGQLQEVAKHTLVDRIRLCVRCLGFGFAHGFVFRAQALRMSFASNSSISRINRLSFTNRPSAPFGYASGTSKSFPRINTYGRASSLVGGLEDKVDCGVCGGAITLPFTDFPSWGTSLELEAGKAGDSPIVGSEEEAAMLPSSSERGSSSSKRRGEVDGGGDSGLEARAGGDSPGFHQVTSPSHPFSKMVPGTRTEQSALMMRSASLMNPFGKSVTTTSSKLLPHHKVAAIDSHITNHPLESVDCESLTPTQGATQQSVNCESLTPTQGATQQSVD